jgi:hypothetical protein
MINFYEKIKGSKMNNPCYDNHKIDLPFRMLVCTASGGGKTNAVINLVALMNKTFASIDIITKEHEPLYDMLASKIKKTKVHLYSETGIPTFDASSKKISKLAIFDDLVLTKDPKINEAFIRLRKCGYSLIYISQSYFQTQKVIRQNVQYVMLGRGINKRDLNMILSEYSLDLTVEELMKLYFQATNKPMNFLLLDFVLRNIRHNIHDIIYPAELQRESV